MNNNNKRAYKYDNEKPRSERHPLSTYKQYRLINIGIGLIFFVMMLFSLAACETSGTDSEEDVPPAAVQEAQSWLAEQLKVPVSEIKLVSSEQVEWTDSCFGLGGPAELCAAVITPGWQADFEVDGQQYEVRFDETGTSFRSPQLS